MTMTTTMTMMTTTNSTTERRGLSVRTRIVGGILLIVTLAVAVIVVATGRSMFTRIDAAAAAELGHEAEKLRTFAAGVDPDTGAAFASVPEMLRAYLSRAVPEADETLFSVVDGRAHLRSAGAPPVRLDRDAAFVADVAATTVPRTGRVNTPAGPAVYAVLPVAAADSTPTAALVVVEFLQTERDEARATILLMSVVSAVALLAALWAGWLVAGRILAPIRDVRETAARISETDLARRIEVSGTDDVAQLAATFNRMLDRLETAFDGQRRFLDDAGHELRTPITIIRGHLDVMRDDPADREETLRLVNDELGRMSRLVDDLILLARAERPGFLVMAPADLADLVVDTLAKMTALGGRTWSIDAVPSGQAVVDGQRLAQALLQLGRNAVDHTGDGDAISIGGEVAGGRIRLWITDAGSGIAVDDQERIFERFDRGADEGRGQGTGLGLAIVARIAAAHGGEVKVDSAPGAGATFTLDIPFHTPALEPREHP